MSSRIPGFYRLNPKQRLETVGDKAKMAPADVEVYRSAGLTVDHADLMVENVISTFGLPNAVAVNFRINGEDRLVPMVVEEPSVVAAVSNMARLAYPSGGFHVESDESVMIGQVQLMAVQDPAATAALVEAALPELQAVAAAVHPNLTARGGGLRGMEVRQVSYDEPGFPVEHMVVLHFMLDCCDAMGANMVNTVAERLAPELEALTGERVGLKILTNLADRRLSRGSVSIPIEMFSGPDVEGAQVAEGIAAAWRFAWADPYRATTHNKGAMNGIDAVAIATGNDWRAIEAGVHAWCCRDGQYRPMTRWWVEDGHLHGTIAVPLQFGTVGGTIRVHPTVQSNLKLLGVRGARDLAGVAAIVGLAQNLGALRALSTEGIQRGHMRMHARSVAGSAGATGDEIARVTARLVAEKNFSADFAAKVLSELRSA